MWLYQVLDITATLTESLGLYLFSICFCKEPRYRASVNRWLITGISFLCAYTLTWFSELGALKAPFLLTIYLVLLKVCYRDSVYQCAVAEELNYIATTMLSESIGMLIAHWICFSRRDFAASLGNLCDYIVYSDCIIFCYLHNMQKISLSNQPERFLTAYRYFCCSVFAVCV